MTVALSSVVSGTDASIEVAAGSVGMGRGVAVSVGGGKGVLVGAMLAPVAIGTGVAVGAVGPQAPMRTTKSMIPTITKAKLQPHK
jgi:hypothetical protein